MNILWHLTTAYINIWREMNNYYYTDLRYRYLGKFGREP
jgi:hypothetical protein